MSPFRDTKDTFPETTREHWADRLEARLAYFYARAWKYALGALVVLLIASNAWIPVLAWVCSVASGILLLSILLASAQGAWGDLSRALKRPALILSSVALVPCIQWVVYFAGTVAGIAIV